ncbi:MAG: helix-turn-helix domain-containing protein [Chloroflexi bacterium]|nr:helix-turn-helix domain-containing protein [Chloroflexota bacterium]
MNELPKKDPDQIVSVKEVAEIAGRTRRTVARWCKSGDLKATLLGKEYAILWKDFVSFWQERNK